MQLLELALTLFIHASINRPHNVHLVFPIHGSDKNMHLMQFKSDWFGFVADSDFEPVHAGGVAATSFISENQKQTLATSYSWDSVPGEKVYGHERSENPYPTKTVFSQTVWHLDTKPSELIYDFEFGGGEIQKTCTLIGAAGTFTINFNFTGKTLHKNPEQVCSSMFVLGR